ncbi:MAG: hypothetical protein RQ745_11915 [Longimicrobiales bacterium]|nr:hypothetical protein [Longimicrobiales bacterium]
MNETESRRDRRRGAGRIVPALVVVFLVVEAFALTWPIATLFNDPGTRILGLPLPFAWSVAWVVATFFVMAGVWWTDRRRER